MTDKQSSDSGQGVTTPDQQITFHSHYVKDLSFENPNAPLIYDNPANAPQVSVNFSVTSTPIEGKDRHYEVVLMIKASAEQGEQTMFLAELSYGGEVSIAAEMDERAVQPVVMIEGPRFLFPFARALMSNVTRDGGFMPLNIQPIDFIKLYQMRMQQQAEHQATQKENGKADN